MTRDRMSRTVRELKLGQLTPEHGEGWVKQEFDDGFEKRARLLGGWRSFVVSLSIAHTAHTM